jgi:hypothetical protein
MAIGNGQTGKQMPVGGVYTYGSSKGKPESQGSIKYGDDLRNGTSKKGK